MKRDGDGAQDSSGGVEQTHLLCVKLPALRRHTVHTHQPVASIEQPPHTHTHTHTHRHTHTHNNTTLHIHPQRDSHPHTHRHPHTHTHIHTDTHTHSFSLSLSHTYTHTHTHTHTLTHFRRTIQSVPWANATPAFCMYTPLSST